MVRRLRGFEDVPPGPGDSSSDVTLLGGGRGQVSHPAAGRGDSGRWLAVGALVCLLLGALFGLWLSRDRNPAEDGVDVGFLRDMVDHHDQAVQMASIATHQGLDPGVERFAFEVVLGQRWELGRMYAWLQDWGYPLGDPEREDAMAWMGHPVPVADMAGMQRPEDVERLADAPDELARSRLFLEMMIDHHRGAVHMADYAAEHASTSKERQFAAVVAANQAREAREYELALEGLTA